MGCVDPNVFFQGGDVVAGLQRGEDLSDAILEAFGSHNGSGEVYGRLNLLWAVEMLRKCRRDGLINLL